MPGPNRSIPAGWASVKQCSAFIGVTPQGLHQSYLPSLSDDDVDRSQRQILVRVAAVIEIMIDRRTAERGSDDPLLATGDSPGLERYRLAKAKHAELDLAQRKGELIDREKCREVLGRWANVLRHSGERLNKRHGAAAGQVLGDALTECERIVDSLRGTDGD